MKITKMTRVPKTGHYRFNMTIEGGITLLGCIYRPETKAVMSPMTVIRGFRTPCARFNSARIPVMRKFIQKAIDALPEAQNEPEYDNIPMPDLYA